MDEEYSKVKGEGEVKVVKKTRVRIPCRLCGEPSTKRVHYLLYNCRSNPRSSAYGRDDCTYCSDDDINVCDDCESEAKHNPPSGMECASTMWHSHMLLMWREEEVTKDNIDGRDIEIKEWMNEDEMTEDDMYSALYPLSKVDGVRMFPKIIAVTE